jgi:hypothetical protein
MDEAKKTQILYLLINDNEKNKLCYGLFVL